MTAEPIDVAKTEPAAVPVLAYASEVGSVTASCEAVRALYGLSFGSGLCVASFFIFFWSGGAFWTVPVHMAVYALVLFKAVRAGGALMRSNVAALRSPLRTTLDVIAGVALSVIGLAIAPMAISGTAAAYLAPVAGLAFAAMALTTWRHPMLYSPLGRTFRDAGYRGFGRTCVVLGGIKFVYEGLWLTCCAMPLLTPAMSGGRIDSGDNAGWMMGALLGCLGYAVIWIVTTVAHGRAVDIVSGWERGRS